MNLALQGLVTKNSPKEILKIKDFAFWGFSATELLVAQSPETNYKVDFEKKLNIALTKNNETSVQIKKYF